MAATKSLPKVHDLNGVTRKQLTNPNGGTFYSVLKCSLKNCEACERQRLRAVPG